MLGKKYKITVLVASPEGVGVTLIMWKTAIMIIYYGGNSLIKINNKPIYYEQAANNGLMRLSNLYFGGKKKSVQTLSAEIWPVHNAGQFPPISNTPKNEEIWSAVWSGPGPSRGQ